MSEPVCRHCGKRIAVAHTDPCVCRLDPMQHALRMFLHPDVYGPGAVQYVEGEYARLDAKS